MYIFKDALCDDVVEICFHELEYKVHISIIFSFDGVEKFDYVDVVDLS